jgi:hypothetical protein
MTSIIKEFKQEHPEIKIIKISTADHHYFKVVTGEDMDVSGTPTFFAIDRGKIISKHFGKICKDRLFRLWLGDTIVSRKEDFKIL